MKNSSNTKLDKDWDPIPAPDISDVYRFPVGDMQWRTMEYILRDLTAIAIENVHHAIFYSDRSLEEARTTALGSLVTAYNYLERWIDKAVERKESEPF
jgi:hypothetical protein